MRNNAIGPMVGVGTAIHLAGTQKTPVAQGLDQNVTFIGSLTRLSRLPAKTGGKARSSPQRVRLVRDRGIIEYGHHRGARAISHQGA